MADKTVGFLEWFLHRRVVARWSRLAGAADGAELDLLRRQRAHARMLSGPLEQLVQTADSRLALPRIGSTSFPRPPGTDWSWRPDLWRRPLAVPGVAAAESQTPFGTEITLFHDCHVSELTLRQVRNTRESDLAAFALRMDVFRFDGSFLSLVLDLPPDATEGLQTRHLIRVDLTAETEKPLEIFARLNVKHGPNVEQLVREFPISEGPASYIEFDLAYSRLNEKRVEKIWMDLIFEGPEMNQITVSDLTFSRYPRAAL